VVLLSLRTREATRSSLLRRSSAVDGVAPMLARFAPPSFVEPIIPSPHIQTCVRNIGTFQTHIRRYGAGPSIRTLANVPSNRDT